MKNQFILYLILFLIVLKGYSQTLEIHQMAVGNADAALIVIRDTTGVLNILKKHVARNLLDSAGYINFKNELTGKNFDANKTLWSTPIFTFILSIQPLSLPERIMLDSALSTGAFNNSQPNITILKTKLNALIPKSGNYNLSLGLINNFTTNYNALFPTPDDRVNMTEKVIDLYYAADSLIDYEYFLDNTVLETIVIDAAREGERVSGYISNYLNLQGVNVIDKFILSHYHDDHYGGFKGVISGLGDIEVKRAYETGIEYLNPGKSGKIKTNYREPMKDALLLVTLDSFEIGNNTKRVARMPDDTIKLLYNTIQMKCVAANSFVVGDTSTNKIYKRGGKNPNDYSLAWVLKYNGFKYFTGGDLSGYNKDECKECSSYNDIETSLAKKLYQSPFMGNKGHVCAFKVSHHGSRCSSNPAFLDTLSSIVAIIPNGKDNMHLNPRPETLERLDTTRGNPEIYCVGLMKQLSRKRIYQGYKKQAKALITNNKLFVTGNTAIIVSDALSGGPGNFIVKWDGALNLDKDEDKDQMLVPTAAGRKAYTCNH